MRLTFIWLSSCAIKRVLNLLNCHLDRQWIACSFYLRQQSWIVRCHVTVTYFSNNVICDLNETKKWRWTKGGWITRFCKIISECKLLNVIIYINKEEFVKQISQISEIFYNTLSKRNYHMVYSYPSPEWCMLHPSLRYNNVLMHCEFINTNYPSR